MPSQDAVRKIFITTLYSLGVLVFFEATDRGVLWSDAGFRLTVRAQDDTGWRLEFIRRQNEIAGHLRECDSKDRGSDWI